MLSFLLENLDALMAIVCGVFLLYGAALVIYDQLPPTVDMPRKKPDERALSARFPSGLYVD